MRKLQPISEVIKATSAKRCEPQPNSGREQASDPRDETQTREDAHSTEAKPSRRSAS